MVDLGTLGGANSQAQGVNSSGQIIAVNDDWKDTEQNDIQATGLAPTDDHESAMIVMLASDSFEPA